MIAHGKGDVARTILADERGESLFFLVPNANIRSLTLNPGKGQNPQSISAEERIGVKIRAMSTVPKRERYMPWSSSTG